MDLEAVSVDPRLFDTLGIQNRRGFDPHLADRIVPVVVLPLAGADLGVQSNFNDSVSEQGQAFSQRSTAGPTVGQQAIVQLFNPVGSGRALYVDGVDALNLTATDRLEMRQHNVALGAGVVAPAGGFNQNIGGAAGAAQLRIVTSGAGPGSVIQEGCALVNVLFQWKLDSPIRIPEGWGLHVTAFTANTLIVVTFRWREKITT